SSSHVGIRRLHAKHAEARRRNRRVERRRERQRKHTPGLLRGDDAVVPQPGGGEIRMALALKIIADRLFERFFLFGTPRPTLAFDAIAANGGENGGRLLATHQRNPSIRPSEQQARRATAPPPHI